MKPEITKENPDARPEHLLIDDPNVGDYGRPFGTYAEKVKAKAREILIAEGKLTVDSGAFRQQVTFMYERHMQALPSYREVSARFAAKATVVSDTRFTEDELRHIYAHFSMANDSLGYEIAKKAQKLLAVDFGTEPE